MTKATCLKEKKTVEIKNPHFEAMRNGGCIVKGTCPSCGGKVSRIVSVEDAPADVKKQCLANKSSYKRKKKGGSRTSSVRRRSSKVSTSSTSSRGRRRSSRGKK